MKRIPHITSTNRPLLSRKTAWIVISTAGLLMYALLHKQFHGPNPAESFRTQAQTQVQSNANPQSVSTVSMPSTSGAQSNSGAAIGNVRQTPAGVATLVKSTVNDESPLNRWQLGTHWGKEAHPALAAFSSWTQRYMTNEPTARDALAAEGVELARNRRTALRELIVTDPREALASSVPFSVRQKLPADVTAQLEQRVSGKGDYRVLGTVPREGLLDGKPAIVRSSVIGQERFTTHVFGERNNQRTSTNISLHGVALDGQLALSESPVRLLEPGEAPASNAQSAEPICAGSGLPAGSAPGIAANDGPVMAASGDQVHWLCRGGHLEALEQKVQAAEQGSGQGGVVAGSYQTTGSRRILVIMVDFSDYPGGPVSLTAARAGLEEVTAFIRANSYNQISFPTKDVTPVLRMPRAATVYTYSDDPYLLMDDARRAADAAGFRTSNYDFDVIAFTSIGFPWGGLGFVGAKGSWVQGNFHRGVTAHELGHNLGNWHANSWVSSTIIGTDGTHNEYGNPYDVLGSVGYFPQSHHSANFKFLNGWLPNTFLHTVTASGTYRIYAQDFGGNLSAGRKYGIRIPVGIFAGNELMDYWVDFRPGFTANSAAANGAVLKWGNDQGTGSASRLLDTQPGTLGDMWDAPLLVGRTFIDPVRDLSIKTLAKGGTGADAYLDMQITFGLPPVTLPEALDLEDTVWLTGGDRPWAGQRMESHDLTDAIASGAINHNQQSQVETTVLGPGTLSYWWKVSSELNFDFLTLLVDGLPVYAISGEQAWQNRTFSLPAGTHRLTWRYRKDGSVVSGSDRAWLDQVSFRPFNDMFSDRIPFSGSAATLLGQNVRATKETGEPNHGGNYGGHSVWWTWTAPASGRMRLTTEGSSFDTLLGVYIGFSPSALSLVNGNDDVPGSLTSGVTFNATAGTTYQIAVDGYGGLSGSIQLNVYPLAPLRLLPPQRLANGTMRIWLASSDGRPLDLARSWNIQVHAATNPTQPGYAWTRLIYPFSPLNGMLFMDDTAAASTPMRFYRAVELP